MNKRKYAQANRVWIEAKAQEEGVKALPKGIYYKVLAEGRNDGNRPYRAGNTGPFPTADERCTGCGTCRNLCPADAIPADNLRSVNTEACISCMRCLSVCPTKARNIGPVEMMVTEKLKTLCATKKSNELFI